MHGHRLVRFSLPTPLSLPLSFFLSVPLSLSLSFSLCLSLSHFDFYFKWRVNIMIPRWHDSSIYDMAAASSIQPVFCSVWLATALFFSCNASIMPPVCNCKWLSTRTDVHQCIFIRIYVMYVRTYCHTDLKTPRWWACFIWRETEMEWLWLVGSLKSYVSFAKYHLFYRALLQKDL